MSKNKCSVKGCDRPIAIPKHALCRPHLQRYYRNGEPGEGQIRVKKIYKSYVAKEKIRKINESI